MSDYSIQHSSAFAGDPNKRCILWPMGDLTALYTDFSIGPVRDAQFYFKRYVKDEKKIPPGQQTHENSWLMWHCITIKRIGDDFYFYRFIIPYDSARSASDYLRGLYWKVNKSEILDMDIFMRYDDSGPLDSILTMAVTSERLNPEYTGPLTVCFRMPYRLIINLCQELKELPCALKILTEAIL